jgi:hypothetical protein
MSTPGNRPRSSNSRTWEGNAVDPDARTRMREVAEEMAKDDSRKKAPTFNTDALALARKTLAGIAESALRATRAGNRPLDSDEIADLMASLPQTNSAKVKASLKAATTRVLAVINDNVGNRVPVDEAIRQISLEIAADAPRTFSAPVSNEDNPATLAAMIPRG